TTFAILDNEERIIGILLGKPQDGDKRSPQECWDACAARIAEAFEKERSTHEKAFAKKDVHRGDFASVSFGPSYGGGQVAPGNLCVLGAKGKIVKRLLELPELQRLAGHQSEGLASFFPKAYHDMRVDLAALYKGYPEIRPNFVNSAYPTAAANLGPSTICVDHIDCSNYPSLPCAITALGAFNPDLGGHLYMWDLKLKIRFPPGSTILLSSAGIRHGNVPIEADWWPIQPGETRYSFTQYCPGGLRRWVRHGFRPALSLSKRERDALDGVGDEGLLRQLSRLSKYDELKQDREWLVAQERAFAA
ncbi:hypothetical protein BV25DRAFT_1810545, partial [Artomyces pyxidatus]